MHSSLSNEMDGKRCIVYLPDNRKLDLAVSGKQLGKDLWEAVLSELYLKEEDYFGLKFKTSGEHYSWIQNDKKILEHDIEMKSTDFPLEFTFSVKCYEDSVTVHKHPSTVELIFLHAQNLLYIGEIYIPSELSLELTAYSLQAFYGDFVSEEIASSNFKKLSCLPRFVLQELPSIEYCEEQVISWYKNLCGISRGQAILYYMSKVEKLADYGVHFFKVKDKGKLPVWLGICNKGIYQYPINDKSTPNLKFLWRNLKNLFFREKKFSVEVCFGHKRALSTGSASAVAEKSKKTEQQSAKTYSWYGSPSLIKSIWLMAIAQHQFYWHRKQSSKSKTQTRKTNASILRKELDNNPKTYILPPTESNTMQRKRHDKNHVGTPTHLRKEKVKASVAPKSPDVKVWEEKMVSDLKKRKLDLEDQLYEKVQELKDVCQEELNLTHRMPFDLLRYVLPWEEKPVPKTKKGASYPVTLRHKNNNRNDSTIASELQRLESECDLLQQITKAASKLACDPTLRGKARKKRYESYKKSMEKLQAVENRIDELRKKQGRDAAFRQSTLFMTSGLDDVITTSMRECSIDDKSERSSLSEGILLDDETSCSSGAEALSTHSTPALSLRPSSRSADVDVGQSIIQRSQTPPPSSSKMAWLETTKVKSVQGQISPNNSYPVLPSPNSFRSTTSHSSGADTPPTHIGQAELRWQQPRQRKPVWKESSLDSLESIESRRSNEQIFGSPSRRGHIPSESARRSARAHKANEHDKNISQEPSNRLNTANPILDIVENTIQDDRQDSRTSLTDSGHGTDSRVPSFHEDDTLRRKKDNRANIKRDISDSELSAKSNPLPSSNLPKFVPYFMSNRARSVTQNDAVSASETNDDDKRVRKRSSSFTEMGNTIVRPTSSIDSRRTLTRSKNQSDSHVSSGSPAKENIPNQEGAPKQRHLLATSQSATELQPPLFETNDNIRRQYFSRSQGQLIRQNSADDNLTSRNENARDTVDSSMPPYVSVVDKAHHYHYPDPQYQRHAFMVRNHNGNNNKLNFGQLYKTAQPQEFRPSTGHVYQMQATQQGSINNNIPKCNSLDSILENRKPPIANHIPEQQRYYQRHEPTRSTPTPPHQYPRYHGSHSNSPREGGTPDPDMARPDKMTIHDRDRFNNETYSEICGMGLGWAPSLDEYGSRASVAESLPAKSKKEDILEMLRERMGKPKRTPSVPNSYAMKAKNESQKVLRARIRTEIKLQEQQSQRAASRQHGGDEPTWEDYKNSMTFKRQQNQAASQVASKSDHTGVNIFAHNQPPPMSHQNYSKQTEHPITGKQGAIHQGYGNGYPMQMNPSDGRSSISMPHNGIYGTIRSQTSEYSYPVYANSRGPQRSPFERGPLSSTLPRKYGSREGSPQQHSSPDRKPVTSIPRHAINPNLPRTHSNPVGSNPKFQPITAHVQHRHQHSADSLLSPQSFISSTHSFPAAGEPRRETASSHNLSQQTVTPQQYQQQGSYYQVNAQQSQKSHMDAEADHESTTKETQYDDAATVVQATRTSPDGHTVSVFSITTAMPTKEVESHGGVSHEKLVKPSTLDRKKAKKVPKSHSKDQLTPTSDTSENSDLLQAMAVEAARSAQKLLTASQGSLDKLAFQKNAPSLPVVPPNSGLRSSIRRRDERKELSNTLDRKGRSAKMGSSRAETLTPRKNNHLETRTPRSRSQTRRDNGDRGRSSSPLIATGSNGVAMPVHDMRSRSKTQLDSNPDSARSTPNFHRTLSTPIRVKHAPSHSQGSNSPKSNRITGMYDEPIMRSTLRPPTAPRGRVSTPTPMRSTKISSDSSNSWQYVENVNFQSGQSGTLPRAPKSHKRLERSGSTSGSVYQANKMVRMHQSKADAKSQSGHNSTPRQENYTFLANEDLKYKRSSSENWKPSTGAMPQHIPQHMTHHQQPPTVMAMTDQYYGQHLHPMYHMPMTQHSGIPHEQQPRRTASADDLLWSSPDARDSNVKLRAQQGTLV